jgi:hypothetical protein
MSSIYRTLFTNAALNAIKCDGLMALLSDGDGDNDDDDDKMIKMKC